MLLLLYHVINGDTSFLDYYLYFSPYLPPRFVLVSPTIANFREEHMTLVKLTQPVVGARG